MHISLRPNFQLINTIFDGYKICSATGITYREWAPGAKVYFYIIIGISIVSSFWVQIIFAECRVLKSMDMIRKMSNH